ncbi:MAG: aldo/keto reductase [Anaerolineae bacterium]|nr:aldo/keto reductase [Anaerolineae bacterium]
MKMKLVPALGLELSAVGFGCWAAGGSIVWNGADDAMTIRTIQRGMDLGINFFDVAPVYGFGHAEITLGRALGNRRSQVIIGSKCGLRWDDAHTIVNNLRPESIRQEIDESLRRLQTDYIDIYQMHWPDPATPIGESMGALRELQAAGKIRHIGVSNFSRELADEARGYGAIVSHQGLYNLLEHNPTHYHNIPLTYRTKDEILPHCQELGLAFFPYSPLFQGLLTEQFKATNQFDSQDVRSANPKLNGALFQVYYAIRAELLAFAQRIGKTLAQVAINWLIDQPAVTSVICGAQTLAQVEENAASASWSFTSEMRAELEQILQAHADVVNS